MVCEFENLHTPRAKEPVGQDRTPRQFVEQAGVLDLVPSALTQLPAVFQASRNGGNVPLSRRVISGIPD
jgi:hypothetical protein